MGINIPAISSLGSISFQFFSFFFFFSANMNLTVFAGILFALTMATARTASLGEKSMQADGKADEPVEAMREAARPASLVEKIMRAAGKADEPDEAKRDKSVAYLEWEAMGKLVDGKPGGHADPGCKGSNYKRDGYCKEHSECCGGYCGCGNGCPLGAKGVCNDIKYGL